MWRGEKVNKNPLRPSVSIIDERSFQGPGIALIRADLAALAAGLTTQVGGQGGRAKVMLERTALRYSYNSIEYA